MPAAGLPPPWQSNRCDSRAASADLRTSSRWSRHRTPCSPRHRAYGAHSRRNFRTKLPCLTAFSVVLRVDRRRPRTDEAHLDGAQPEDERDLATPTTRIVLFIVPATQFRADAAVGQSFVEATFVPGRPTGPRAFPAAAQAALRCWGGRPRLSSRNGAGAPPRSNVTTTPGAKVGRLTMANAASCSTRDMQELSVKMVRWAGTTPDAGSVCLRDAQGGHCSLAHPTVRGA
jgi:hypothetical protein